MLTHVQTYYYRRTPFLKNPPAVPAPNPDLDPEWYGEIYVRYPLSPTITRMHLGHVMKATINLRIIMNEIALAQFSSYEPIQLSPNQVLGFKRRLEDLMQKIPAALMPSKIMLPCHFNVQ